MNLQELDDKASKVRADGGADEAYFEICDQSWPQARLCWNWLASNTSPPAVSHGAL